MARAPAHAYIVCLVRRSIPDLPRRVLFPVCNVRVTEEEKFSSFASVEICNFLAERACHNVVVDQEIVIVVVTIVVRSAAVVRTLVVPVHRTVEVVIWLGIRTVEAVIWLGVLKTLAALIPATLLWNFLYRNYNTYYE